jgi:hypothetical protein
LKTERSNAKENDNNGYFSIKIYDNIGKPGSIYFGVNGEIGCLSREKGIMFSGGWGGGYANWGGGLNVGFLIELPNKNLLIPGISSGFWYAYNKEYYLNFYVNNSDYANQCMFGGPFVKYLIGKKNRYFEISTRALMGKVEKRDWGWHKYTHYYGNETYLVWDYDIADVFLINLNIACGITILF